ncbi:MAG: DAK2 domain-containing protein [Oscillospiraceae bacterium]
MLTGQILREALISGANNISNNRQLVDSLNVFPVPDGDTGTNMSMTVNSAIHELKNIKDTASVAVVSKTAAAAFLRGARGNSGVILSLLFRGLSMGFAGKETADAKDIASALSLGVDAAYKAVMKPTEGTMLTVARMAAEHASSIVTEETTVAEIWSEIISAADDALKQTPEMLPVLKKAGVVDAGGKGILMIFQGMNSIISGGNSVELLDNVHSEEEMKTTEQELADLEGVITFTYCTEFLVKKNENTPDYMALREFLEKMGDSVVTVDDDEIIKCHVHTDNPGSALQEALKFGQLTHIKIENMREQFEAKYNKDTPLPSNGFNYLPVDPSREFGFVSVSAGDGIKQLFSDLGVDQVVSGGQTMNPSTEDILSAIHATPAKNVFVLPNNKNIIMAAEQAIALADRNVYVMQTRTIPQGLSAMLAFDADEDVKTNQLVMTKAFEKVSTGQITFAARDSDFGGHQIKKDDILALENGKLVFTEREIQKAVVKLTTSLIKKHGSREGCFVTLIYGEDITEEQAALAEQAISDKLGDSVEIALIQGNQPVYYYIISVE